MGTTTTTTSQPAQSKLVPLILAPKYNFSVCERGRLWSHVLEECVDVTEDDYDYEDFEYLDKCEMLQNILSQFRQICEPSSTSQTSPTSTTTTSKTTTSESFGEKCRTALTILLELRQICEHSTTTTSTTSVSTTESTSLLDSLNKFSSAESSTEFENES